MIPKMTPIPSRIRTHSDRLTLHARAVVKVVEGESTVRVMYAARVCDIQLRPYLPKVAGKAHL